MIELWTVLVVNLCCLKAWAARQIAAAAFWGLSPQAAPLALNRMPETNQVTGSNPFPVAFPAPNNDRRSRRRSSMTLSQFLYDLLSNGEHKKLIQWTKENEFKLNDPEAVATLWGELKGNATMNYEKMSRGLRYYYGKGIMEKVTGDKYAYRFLKIPEK